eukprot:Sspe_Gene.94910::Locus_67221_Transcript_1_1_Confidence_1.000_Length_665::g.94910::m.94910
MITKLRLVLTFIENKVYADGDSPSVKAKKKAALVFGLFMVVIYPIYLTYYILKPGEYYELLAPALTVACAPSIILFLYLLRTKCLPLYSVEVSVTWLGVGIIIIDVAGRPVLRLLWDGHHDGRAPPGQLRHASKLCVAVHGVSVHLPLHHRSDCRLRAV